MPAWPDILEPSQISELEAIRKAAGEEVEKTLLLHYTDHSIGHLDRVTEHFISIGNLGNRGIAPLSNLEWFAGLASCYLHDVALQNSRNLIKKPIDEWEGRDYDQLRRAHGQGAYDRVLADVKSSVESGETRLPSLGVRDGKTARMLADVIAMICKVHTGGLNQVTKLEDKQFTEGTIRVRLLAHLLRIADGIDLDRRRVNMDDLTRYEIKLESQFHWWRHHFVDSVAVSDRGRIRVHLSFPQSTHVSYMDSFARSVVEYIEKETKAAADYLIDNGFNLHIPAPVATNAYADSKEKLTKSLMTYMEKIDPEIGRVTNPSSFELKPVSKRARHYQDTWGISGNPWNLIPINLKQQEFVTTERIGELLGEIEFLRAGVSGELRLLYGPRGGGKTSFLDSVFAQYDPENTVKIDVVRASGDLPTEFQLYDWVFREVHAKLTGRASKDKIGATELQRALQESKMKKPIILLDNLDRFMEDPNPEVLQRFFGLAQGNFESLRGNALVIISATTRWQELLDTEEFNYLGGQSFMELAAFTTEETRELIDRRLQISGSSYSKVFTNGVARRLCQFSRGVPREILLAAQRLCDSAANDGIQRIDANYADKHLGSDIDQKIRRAAIDHARSLPAGQQSLREIYSFNVACQQGTEDDEMAWGIFVKLASSESLSVGSTPNELIRAVGYIANRHAASPGSKDYWVLKPHIKKYVQELAAHGITAEEFSTAFWKEPINFRPDQNEVKKKIQIGGSGNAKQLLGQALNLIHQGEAISGDPTRVLKKVHFAAERLFLARAATSGQSISSNWIENNEGIIQTEYGRTRRKRPDAIVSDILRARGMALEADQNPTFRNDAYSITNRTIKIFKDRRKAAELTPADADAALAAAKSLFEYCNRKAKP